MPIIFVVPVLGGAEGELSRIWSGTTCSQKWGTRLSVPWMYREPSSFAVQDDPVGAVAAVMAYCGLSLVYEGGVVAVGHALRSLGNAKEGVFLFLRASSLSFGGSARRRSPLIREAEARLLPDILAHPDAAPHLKDFFARKDEAVRAVCATFGLPHA